MFPLRSTTDVDIAVALRNWERYDAIAASFPALGHNGIRFRIAGSAVDVMPFGGVEEPEGTATPASRGEALVVFGFTDVFESATTTLALPSGQVRLPTAPGYGALKVRAWVDRAPFGEDKDARDLAAVLFWYLEDAMVRDRVWEPAREHLLEELGWDEGLARARLLGDDIGATLSPTNRADLATRLRSAARLEARAFEFGHPAGWTFDLRRRRALFDQVLRGIVMSATA